MGEPEAGVNQSGGVNTVDTGNFRVFKFARISDFGTFHEVIIHEFAYFLSSAIVTIIFARFLNSRICPREN